MEHIKVILGIISSIYLYGAFLSLEWNPLRWSEEGRIAYLTVITLFITAYCGIIHFTLPNKPKT